MCGISGIFGLERIDSPGTVVQRMNKRMGHRGPDAEGVFVSEQVALGHRRLSIIDLNDNANQPMTSYNGRYTLVFNGEIYNFRELKSELQYPFQTESDTEVVIAAWSQWGPAALQRFNGMFAFALWDEEQKELFLVRDRLGIKPLYYAEKDHSVFFASEVRALLASGLIQKKLCKTALADYMRYQTVHAPDTLVEGVKMLLPGHYMKIADTETSITKYWSISECVRSIPLSDDEYRNQTRTLLSQSVSRRLVADVPFGAFLSGGIDSSLIVALMSQHLKDPVKTFTISFDESEFSEARYARMVAEKFGAKHTEIILQPSEFLKELPAALAAMDHPSGDGANTFVVSRATREAGITMALSGTGGDELFAGYEVFKRMDALRQRRWLLSFPKWFRNLGGNMIQIRKRGLASWKMAAVLSADYFDLEYLYWVSRLMLTDNRIKDIAHFAELPANRVFGSVATEVGYGTPGFKLPFLSQVSIAEITTYLQHVLLRDTDQMSMAHALEVRVPFLDHELVEFVLGVPDRLKYPHTPKKFLTDCFSDLLIPEIVNRPKMGFTFPWQNWLQNELRDFVGDSLSDLGKSSHFNPVGLQNLWSDFEKSRYGINWSRIMYIVTLQQWLVQNEIND